MKSKELGAYCDSQVDCWKEQCSLEKEKEICLSKLKANLLDIAYLAKLPTVNDVEQYLKEHFNMDESISQENMEQLSLQSGNEFETLNTNELNLCFDQPKSSLLLHNICSSLDANKEVVRQLLEGIIDSALGCNVSLIEVVEHQLQNVKTAIPYQIVGDNVDLEIKVRHMDKDNRNKSMHFFNLVAFEDRVTGNELPDTHAKTLADVPISSFLPTTMDLIKLKRDFIILLSRVIVKHFKSLHFLKSCVIYHNPHQYSEIMTKPVNEVSTNQWTRAYWVSLAKGKQLSIQCVLVHNRVLPCTAVFPQICCEHFGQLFKLLIHLEFGSKTKRNKIARDQVLN